MKIKRLLAWLALLIVLASCAPKDNVTTNEYSTNNNVATLVAQTENTRLYQWYNGWHICFFTESKETGVASSLWCN